MKYLIMKHDSLNSEWRNFRTVQVWWDAAKKRLSSGFWQDWEGLELERSVNPVMAGQQTTDNK
jgi:hypothetical protein